MPKGKNPVELVKRAALEAVEASKPVNLQFGTVLSTAPLRIQADQKSIYTEAMLLLTRNVTDYQVFMSVDHETESEDGADASPPFGEHRHAYQGKKAFWVHNGLLPGEKVLLARIQNGKKFVVLDRIGGN